MTPISDKSEQEENMVDEDLVNSNSISKWLESAGKEFTVGLVRH